MSVERGHRKHPAQRDPQPTADFLKLVRREVAVLLLKFLEDGNEGSFFFAGAAGEQALRSLARGHTRKKCRERSPFFKPGDFHAPRDRRQVWEFPRGWKEVGAPVASRSLLFVAEGTALGTFSPAPLGPPLVPAAFSPIDHLGARTPDAKASPPPPRWKA